MFYHVKIAGLRTAVKRADRVDERGAHTVGKAPRLRRALCVVVGSRPLDLTIRKGVRMDGNEDICVRFVCNLAACLKLLDSGCLCALWRDLGIPRTREDHGRSLRFEQALDLLAHADRHRFFHDACGADRPRIAAAVSGIDGDLAPLQPDDLGDIPINVTAAARLFVLVLLLLTLLRKLHRRLYLRCGLLGYATRRASKVHDDTRLVAAQGKDLVPVLAHGSLHHDADSCLVELRDTYGRGN